MTLTEVRTELRRELSVRKRVYPKWVAVSKLTQAEADHRIAAIEEALRLLPPDNQMKLEI